MKIGKTVGPAIFLVLLLLAVLPLVIYAQPLKENYRKALDLAGQGEFSEAKKGFQKILAAEPSHEQAERSLQILADLEKQKINGQTASHLFKALSYSQKGWLRETMAEADLALQLNPNYERAYIVRGGFYLEQGQNDRALADYNRAVELDPQNAGAYYNRGCLYLKTEKYERAIADFDRALALEPNFAGAFYNRGLAQLRKGEFSWALADLKQAQEINPRLAEANYNIAVVLEQLGQVTEAAQAYNNFLQSATPASNREMEEARRRFKKLQERREDGVSK